MSTRREEKCSPARGRASGEAATRISDFEMRDLDLSTNEILSAALRFRRQIVTNVHYLPDGLVNRHPLLRVLS